MGKAASFYLLWDASVCPVSTCLWQEKDYEEEEKQEEEERRKGIEVGCWDGVFPLR